MTNKTVGNIERMMAKWHYYKWEVDEMLGIKANKDEVPTETSDLENDVPFVTESDLQVVADAISRFNVDFDCASGKLVVTIPRIVND